MQTLPTKGKCSIFGGPNDAGVGPDEGLALVESTDLMNAAWRPYFLPVQPPGTTGLARRLNPNSLYCAMRWSEYGLSRPQARQMKIKVTFQGQSVICKPVDFGPGDGTIVDSKKTLDTGRVIDLSPGAARQIGAVTDDVVQIEVAS
jgi:hypothetical protein